MQAGTVGDTFQLKFFQGDTNSPYIIGSPTSIQVVYRAPGSNTNNILTGSQLAVHTSDIVFLSTANMFPVAGTYTMQVIFNYPAGPKKTRVFGLTIQESLL